MLGSISEHFNGQHKLGICWSFSMLNNQRIPCIAFPEINTPIHFEALKQKPQVASGWRNLPETRWGVGNTVIIVSRNTRHFWEAQLVPIYHWTTVTELLSSLPWRMWLEVATGMKLFLKWRPCFFVKTGPRYLQNSWSNVYAGFMFVFNVAVFYWSTLLFRGAIYPAMLITAYDTYATLI